ncbi:MAG: hypothetical protein QOF21_2934 [Actinomycetota bacterium]|jgi:hypothetical protein
MRCVTKSRASVEEALRLAATGLNMSQISRATGVSRAAIREWIADPARRLRAHVGSHAETEPCPHVLNAPATAYAYLLGQYLGDGCISALGPRGVFRLRIATCDMYPDIRARCVEAIETVIPGNKVGFTRAIGCTEVSGYSKHWPCLFPQHGPGRKHEREIRLVDWQDAIVTEQPREFLAGLIHSDGCRCVNNVVTRGKSYSYPRYFFSNVSKDILYLCAAAFDQIGVDWRQNRWNSLSVAKRDSVAFLDTFIGPKT